MHLVFPSHHDLGYSCTPLFGSNLFGSMKTIGYIVWSNDFSMSSYLRTFGFDCVAHGEAHNICFATNCSNNITKTKIVMFTLEILCEFVLDCNQFLAYLCCF